MPLPAGYTIDKPEKAENSAKQPKLPKGYTLDASQTAAPDSTVPKGARVVGRNAAGRPMYAPEEAAKPVGGAASRFLSSAGEAIGGAVSGLYHGVAEGAQNPEEAKTVQKTGRAGLIAKRFLIDPAKQQAQQTASEFQQARTAPNKYVAREHAQKAAAHALATALPGVGPWAAQVGEQLGTQIGQGDIAGAAGTAAGNVGLYAAPHAAKGIARAGGAAARSTAEALTGTGPRGLRNLAESTVKANADAAVKTAEKNAEAARAHMEKTQEALHETSGREQTHAEKVKTADELARSKHAADVAKVKEDNARVRARHAADIERVRKDNARIMAKHKETADQIAQENAATDHALELRRAEEAGLQQDTTNYYAKEDAVKAKAKAATDKAWKPWHDKMAGVTIDGGEISEPLKKITKLSPEVARVINQLTPDPEDAPPESMYAKDRAAIMKSQGYKENYWDLSPEKKAEVDKIASTNGFEPEPIDFNPEPGKAIPAEQLHRARSIVGRNVYSGKYEGPLLGEMKQLLKTLDQAETRASMNAGALDDLKAAREETQKYQKAFGRERHVPKTQDEIRKREANPEQFDEENDRERLNAAQVYDPSLVKDYEKVQARREQLKKMQTEDQLRKARKQIPPPPSPDDLREGYRLKPEPEPPTPDDLRPGYRLQSEPEPPAPAAEKIEQPERVPLPPRPEEIQPERKTISPEDLAESRKSGVTASAESLRQQGVRRTINALYYTAPAAVLSTLLGHPGYAFTEVAMAPVILAGSHALAGMLERPEVVNWISKVTPKDVAMFNRLPAEEKAVFTQNLNTLVKAAKKKNLPVAQALTAFVAGSVASAPGPKTLMQLRKEAAQRQQQQQEAQDAKTDDTETPSDEESPATPPEQQEPDTTSTEEEPETEY
jgi:predicted transposase YbfD/YdcC